jgi:hypothetical protein
MIEQTLNDAEPELDHDCAREERQQHALDDLRDERSADICCRKEANSVRTDL